MGISKKVIFLVLASVSCSVSGKSNDGHTLTTGSVTSGKGTPDPVADGQNMLKYLASERNKGPILDELKNYLKNNTFLLEIASGTGQHVAHFAQHFPQVQFQPTEYDHGLLASIKSYKDQYQLTNILEPAYLNVCSETWLDGKLSPDSVDYVFNANMAHITPYECTKALFRGSGVYLKENGLLFMYGAFSHNGVISPRSNVNFDQGLRHSNPLWGLRDLENDLVVEASKHRLYLQTFHRLPANNDLLVWKKKIE